MSTETVEAPETTGIDSERTAHAYCQDQTHSFPDVPAGGALAWCGHRKTTPYAHLGEVPNKEKCVVCVDLIGNCTPCPHCGKLPW